MLKPTSTSRRSNPRQSTGGFTLLEMLVSMAVLALMLVLFGQITGNTVSATQAAHRQMDVSFQARSAFDRIALNLNCMMRTNGVTIAVYKSTSTSAPNDAIAFISNARPSSNANGGSSLSVSQNQIPQVRGSMVAFGAPSSPDSMFGGSTSTTAASSPMLSWGNHSIYWGQTQNTNLTAELMGKNAAPNSSFPGDLMSGTGINSSGKPAAPYLNWQPIAPNIFRFCVCFLLSDGSIVGTAPPLDTNFPASNNGVSYLALSPGTSSNGLYVRALIVGVAGLSGEARQITNLTTLATALPSPVIKNQTPLDVWDVMKPNSSIIKTLISNPAIPQPAITALRVYQHFYYVN